MKKTSTERCDAPRYEAAGTGGSWVTPTASRSAENAVPLCWEPVGKVIPGRQFRGRRLRCRGDGEQRHRGSRHCGRRLFPFAMVAAVEDSLMVLRQVVPLDAASA
ncbi:hypothetical protein [Streptomyces albogriseolus]|uniref:hypothetical protein n=1 Tax=Streptomyces albogriseolus TaxID=1887 RepID=UPI0033B92A5D